MKAAIHVKKRSLAGDARIAAVKARLVSGGYDIYSVSSAGDLQPDTGVLLSLGGDGTFLSSARIVGDSGIPVLGINFGRLGFLSGYSPDEAVSALLSGEYTVEDRALLDTVVSGSEHHEVSFNEVTVHRNGAAMLGVDVSIDGEPLPTCWADGFLIATSSGSTAYSLSVGGPICTPDADVLVLAPIAPHNLNIRPIVVPLRSRIELSFRSRNETVMLTMDNLNTLIPATASISVSVARFSLKCVRLGKSNFIQALKNKLYWGEDVRNQ